ncbi:MAG: ATP-binding protein [Clostridium sp.]
MQKIFNKTLTNSSSSKTVLLGFIPLIIIVFFVTYCFGDKDTLIKLIGILSASIGAAIGIIAFIRKENSGIYYRTIGIGFIFLSILEFIYILTELSPNLYFNEEIINIILNCSQFYIEYLIIILPYLFSKKKSTLINSFFIYIVCIVLISGIISILYESKVSIGINMFYKSNLLYLFVFMVISIALTRESKIFEKSINRRHIYVYIVFVFISQILDVLKIGGLENSKVLSEILQYCAYFVLYEGTIEHLLTTSYDEMKENLNQVREAQQIFNNELNIKNQILSEQTISLNKSENHYNKMLSNFNDAIALFYENKVVYVNDTARRLLGVSDEILTSMYLEDVIRNAMYNIFEKDMERMLNEITRRKVEPFNQGEFIWKGIKYNGNEYELYVVRADNENHILYIKNVTEISSGIEKQKEYENLMKEKALKEDFYTNISHELRTPVNVIYGSLQLKEIYIKSKDLEKYVKGTPGIKQNCLRLIRTINNFIDTNKITEGYMKPEFKTYNIVEVIENICQASIKYISRINGTLIFDSEFEEIYTKFDKLMIERVMLNLLSNSVKYGKNGGEINVNIYKDNNKVLISLKNNGYTIPLESHPYIFRKFTKSDSSLSRGKEGSGLGLYLVNELIKINNGSLELTTNEEGENEFIVKLPIKYKNTDLIYSDGMEINTLEEKVDIEFSDIYY